MAAKETFLCPRFDLTHPLTTVSSESDVSLDVDPDSIDMPEVCGTSPEGGARALKASVEVLTLEFLEAERIARIVGGREEYSGGEMRIARWVPRPRPPPLAQVCLQLLSRLIESL